MAMKKPIVTKQTALYCNENRWDLLKASIERLNPTKIFILVDTNTHRCAYELLLKKIDKQLDFQTITMPCGEEHKTLHTCIDIWSELSKRGADRKSVLINLGGGVVTDVGGFVASTYKRGIDFINVPTSLLAMVDAAIGGKNGVNLGVLKNQVGAINTPCAVLVDPIFLHTLPEQEITSGFAEMLKHALIDSQEYWEELQNFNVENINSTQRLIWRSITIKNNIVLQDLNEMNVRKTLNFGHTLGHAIESYCLENKSIQTLSHGKAVAIGIVLATYISSRLMGFDKDKLMAITSFILSVFKKQVFNTEDIASIIALLIHDKKNKDGAVLFVLLEDYGVVHLDKKVPNSLIEEAFEFYDKS